MRYTIHVPDNFEHSDMLEYKVRQLGLSIEHLNLSKSFRINGQNNEVDKFLKYIKQFKHNGVSSLNAIVNEYNIYDRV